MVKLDEIFVQGRKWTPGHSTEFAGLRWFDDLDKAGQYAVFLTQEHNCWEFVKDDSGRLIFITYSV